MLEAKNVWISAPGAPEHSVLEGFSLRVARGEWVALAGANGSGKTTVALALAGLRPARLGSVEWDGAPIRPGTTGRRSRIAVVLEQPSSQLFQETVADEVAFTARNLGLGDEEFGPRANRWIRRFGLEQHLTRDPRELSAGGQQLVLLAAALASGPELLVADEAGAHLDSEALAVVLGAVREEVRSGLTVVWVTQARVETEAADRVITLGSRGGEIPWVVPGPVGDGGGTLVRVRVAPWDGRPGPHVETDLGFEVEIPRRGVVVLSGRNGAGKSAILSRVAGLGGFEQVTLEWGTSPDVPPAYAGQFPELQTFEERVGDEIVFAAVSRGMPRAEALSQAAQDLGHLGIEGRSFLRRITWDLSAGERRILQVIGALTSSASIVILDEPSVGLDATKQAGLSSLIRRRSLRSAVLLASHDRAWSRAVGTQFLELPIHGQLPAKKRIDRTMS